MAFIKVSDPQGTLFSFVENFTLELHPSTYFVSSSVDGIVSGSVPLQARSMSGSIKLNLDAGKDAYETASDFSVGSWETSLDTEDLGVFVPEFLESGPWRQGSEFFREAVVAKAARVFNASPEGPASNPATYEEEQAEFSVALETFMGIVRQRPSPAKTVKRFAIERFEPPFVTKGDMALGKNETTRKNHRRYSKSSILDTLCAHYGTSYSSTFHGFTNYNTINFFTNGTSRDDWNQINENERVPTNSVLLYPNFTGSRVTSLGTTAGRAAGPDGSVIMALGTLGRHQGPYSPHNGPFSLSFYINPRYTNSHNGEFHAGTILHLSSTYSVSLVTGSSTDHAGLKNGYRLMVQLSSSADFSPNEWLIRDSGPIPIYGASNSNYKTDPYKYAFVTPDNSLKRNHWHHVTIRWGGRDVNQSTGSIVIDQDFDRATFFTIPSASIATFTYDNGGSPSAGERINNLGDPDALCIGNFYKGTNKGPTGLINFFNPKICSEEGLRPKPAVLGAAGHTTGSDPTSFAFNNPLNAEIHDIRFYKEFLTDSLVMTASVFGPNDIRENGMHLYIPVFYSPNRKNRRYMVTGLENSQRKFVDRTFPLGEVSSDSVREDLEYIEAPYNVGFEYNTSGFILNPENFLKDFSSDVYPRMLFMTASARLQPPAGYKSAAASFGADYSGPESNSSYDDERKALRDGLSDVNHYKNDVNNFLYKTGSYVKRNLSILPNDNGKLIPNFKLLISGTSGLDNGEVSPPSTGSNMYFYRDAAGSLNLSVVNLTKLIPLVRAQFTEDFEGELLENGRWSYDAFNEICREIQENTGSSDSWTVETYDLDSDLVSPNNPYGRRPQDIGPEPDLSGPDTYPSHTGFFSTCDSTGNAVSIFNIPNLYYGDSIQTETFEITDNNLTGSRESISITLKDDGKGGLYRANCLTDVAKWNTVGNLFYNEGVAIIKYPSLFGFGKDKFEASFKGDRNLNAMIVNVPVGTAQFNSSSNPAYHSVINGFTTVSASLNVNDIDKEFVYITGINLHDNNYNVVAKANLSQPVKKRLTDTYMFRLKMDF